MAAVPFLGVVVEIGPVGRRPEQEPDGAARAAPPGPAVVAQGDQAEGVRDHRALRLLHRNHGATP